MSYAPRSATLFANESTPIFNEVTNALQFHPSVIRIQCESLMRVVPYDLTQEEADAIDQERLAGWNEFDAVVKDLRDDLKERRKRTQDAPDSQCLRCTTLDKAERPSRHLLACPRSAVSIRRRKANKANTASKAAKAATPTQKGKTA